MALSRSFSFLGLTCLICTRGTVMPPFQGREEDCKDRCAYKVSAQCLTSVGTHWARLLLAKGLGCTLAVGQPQSPQSPLQGLVSLRGPGGEGGGIRRDRGGARRGGLSRGPGGCCLHAGCPPAWGPIPASTWAWLLESTRSKNSSRVSTQIFLSNTAGSSTPWGEAWSRADGVHSPDPL